MKDTFGLVSITGPYPWLVYSADCPGVQIKFLVKLLIAKISIMLLLLQIKIKLLLLKSRIFLLLIITSLLANPRPILFYKTILPLLNVPLSPPSNPAEVSPPSIGTNVEPRKRYYIA